MSTTAVLLSVFDAHIHCVLGVNREQGVITYFNKKAIELFGDSILNETQYVNAFLHSVRPVGNEEHLYHSKGIFKIHRLESNQFEDSVLFLEPLEDEPGKKVVQTGELAASLVAHLFRSPLTALIGLADMVNTATDANKEMIAKALTEGLQRMGGFVDDLDSFTKPEKLDIQAVQLNALVQAHLYELASSDRQKIQFFPFSSAEEVQTDPRLVKEILSELITNAFDFGADALSPIEIHIKNSSTIWVGNSGMITKDVESSVFQPFFSTKSQNWGLGLTKAVKKAHALNGTLRLIENSRIKGIVFELALLTAN